MDHVTCERCQGTVEKDQALVRTIMIAPPMYGYSHPDCTDPWADYVGYGVDDKAEVEFNKMLREAMDKPLDPAVFKGEDPVNSPSHYQWLPNGVEVIDITETLNFTMGNAVKYILRADHKGKPEEDIAKAIWYLKRELERRSRDNGNESK